jgi:hypothetical protein
LEYFNARERERGRDLGRDRKRKIEKMIGRKRVRKTRAGPIKLIVVV